MLVTVTKDHVTAALNLVTVVWCYGWQRLKLEKSRKIGHFFQVLKLSALPAKIHLLSSPLL